MFAGILRNYSIGQKLRVFFGEGGANRGRSGAMLTVESNELVLTLGVVTSMQLFGKKK